jgi:hypothetical protein
MSDSIDLLEAVGRDASLRRLPPDELASRLKEAGASEVLAAAASQRDSALLCAEFGTRVMGQPNLGNIAPAREQPAPLEVPGEDDDGESDDEQQGKSAATKVH